MTLLEINLTDVLSETDPDDRVIVWAPVMREGPAGQLVGPRRKSIPLTDGVGSDEVVPGPLMVQVQCKAMSDTRPREVVVPEEGPVTLTALFDSSGAFTYSPAVVNRVLALIEGARDETLGQVASAVAAEIGNTTHVISDGQTTHANKVVRLNADGKLAIGSGTVTGLTDPTNKTYVDTAVNAKADRTHTHNAADITGNTTQYVNFATDNRFAGHLVKLNGDGKFHISTAGITGINDPVNKQYVDATAALAAENATDELQAKIGSRLAWWN